MESIETMENYGKIKLACEGYNWDKDKNAFIYNISVNDGCGYIKIIMKSYTEMLTFLNQLKMKRFVLLRKVDSSERSTYEPEEPKKFSQNLDDIFEEMTKREDIMSDPSFLSLFQINKITTCYLPPKLISRSRISDSMNLSDLIYEPNKGILIATFQNASALSRIGRVWSLIDAEILGSVKIFKRKSAVTKMVPEFDKGLSKDFEIKPLSACYIPAINMVFFGFHDGNVMSIRFNASNPDQNQIKSEAILGESILALVPIGNDAIVIATASIKVVNEELAVVGGGSLRKRLGSENVTCAQFDLKSTLFIGTSAGVILVYDIKREDKIYKLTFLEEFMAKKDRPIDCLLYRKGNLFCAQGLDVSVWSHKLTPKFALSNTATFVSTEDMKNQWAGFNIISLEYHVEQKILMAGVSNGLTIFWSAKYGDIFSIIHFHYSGVQKLLLFEDRDLLYSASQSGELRLWKLGELPKEMLDEVKFLQLEF